MAGGTGALVSSNANFAGVDQGIDFTASSPFNIFALADGVITRLIPTGSGWPGSGGKGTGALLVYKANNGLAAGQNIYVAENFIPASGLAVGSPVKAGQVLGTAPGPYPGIETGFADSSGHAFGTPTGGPQPLGQEFYRIVQMISGSGGNGTPADREKFLSATKSPIPLPDLGGPASSVGSAVGGAAQHVPGVAQVEGLASGVSSVGDFLGRLTNPSYILRGLQILAGAILALAGLLLLARQVGLAVPSVPGPSRAVAGAVS